MNNHPFERCTEVTATCALPSTSSTSTVPFGDRVKLLPGHRQSMYVSDTHNLKNPTFYLPAVSVCGAPMLKLSDCEAAFHSGIPSKVALDDVAV